MGDLNMQIVREFFELNRFHVLTHWQHERIPQISDFGSLLFVEHPHGEVGGEVDFVPRPDQIAHIPRAVVEVRAWHTDRFYPSTVETSPVLGHVAGEEVHDLAHSIFNSAAFTTILVVSELPHSHAPRQRSIELLRAFGIGHVLEFSTILQDILARISAHGHYAPSQTLQTMHLLKRYGLIRRQQLEFSFPLEAPPANEAPVDTTTDTETHEESL